GVEPQPNSPLQEIIILDPDDQPVWESAMTIALTPNSIIVRPDVDDNFVINSTNLKMIRENKFDGYLWADPHDNIHEFLAICNMFKYGETQSEAVKLLIFPLSLCNKAKTWFNELNEESITSWEQMRRAFINRFFPPSLFNSLLLEIRNFSQNVCESLTEAWDDQSKTDLEKSINKFLDGQRVSNMFVKNNVNDIIIKMKQNEKNYQTIFKNLERKIDEWSKSQNVSSEQADRTEPPPHQARNEHVNAVFIGSEKSDESPKTQKDPPPPIIVNNKNQPIKASKKEYHVVKTNEYPFQPTELEIQEMVNILVSGEAYDKVFNHLYAPLEGKNPDYVGEEAAGINMIKGTRSSSSHYKEPTELEIQEMVNILVSGEAYDKVFNHLHAPLEGKCSGMAWKFKRNLKLRGSLFHSWKIKFEDVHVLKGSGDDSKVIGDGGGDEGSAAATAAMSALVVVDIVSKPLYPQLREIGSSTKPQVQQRGSGHELDALPPPRHHL
ncbi:reverse transcriptase domain-containing protein, partial [Tanacetum coccineum]